jgi:hypothetical protein
MSEEPIPIEKRFMSPTDNYKSSKKEKEMKAKTGEAETVRKHQPAV